MEKYGLHIIKKKSLHKRLSRYFITYKTFSNITC